MGKKVIKGHVLKKKQRQRKQRLAKKQLLAAKAKLVSGEPAMPPVHEQSSEDVETRISSLPVLDLSKCFPLWHASVPCRRRCRAC